MGGSDAASDGARWRSESETVACEGDGNGGLVGDDTRLIITVMTLEVGLAGVSRARGQSHATHTG